MIRIITAETARYYEAQAAKARNVPFLEHQMREAKDDVAMWKAQSADYLKQRDEEHALNAQLVRELREAGARLRGQQAEFDRQMDEARKPVVDMLTDLLDRLNHPVQGAEFRKELALRVVEKWVEKLTPEDHDSPLGLILRIITDTKEAGDPGETAPPAPEARLPEADPGLVGQMRDAALLKGPDPFPGVG
ncbi:hypothetical protein KN815_16125 [Streptomyces sp. 4503]|uniref:Uncharacterized protein n=1 Tax=Streptomyces niphimycinicus TaxID=2842201 RepID=A0ABS6CFC7_9ACTN|nr:hypothetical protein [Streptomyces niphimycinicus]MBU3865549.1 hypothetical protein [Streptomyces niphimycinicus]